MGLHSNGQRPEMKFWGGGGGLRGGGGGEGGGGGGLLFATILQFQRGGVNKKGGGGGIGGGNSYPTTVGSKALSKNATAKGGDQRRFWNASILIKAYDKTFSLKVFLFYLPAPVPLFTFATCVVTILVLQNRI